MSDEHFLSRWSRLKHEAKGKPEEPEPIPVPAPIAEQPPAPVEPPPLPSVESLTPESDFSAFMTADVDPGLRRDALKKLFADPRFNVMDGLDVYIDDYSKPDPLPEGWLEKLNQVARLGAFVEKPETEAQEAAETPSRPEQAAENPPALETPEPLPASDTDVEVPTLVPVRKS